MKPKASFPVIIVATLPLMSQLNSPLYATLMGGLVCLVTLLTALFFKQAGSLFPPKLFPLSVVVWMMVVGQTAWVLGGVVPFWCASVFILLPLEWRSGKKTKTYRAQKLFMLHKKSDKEILVQTFGFWGVCIFLGFIQTGLYRYSEMEFFKTPSGTLLLLAILFLFWQRRNGAITGWWHQERV